MELIDGATLVDVVELSGPVPAARVARILRDVASALAEAHGAGGDMILSGVVCEDQSCVIERGFAVRVGPPARHVRHDELTAETTVCVRWGERASEHPSLALDLDRDPV